MRLAGLADLHLGHRRFDRNAPGGMDQRELDVATAFQRAMAAIRTTRPDVIAIAGDFFDRVRPPNTAITMAFRELTQTMEALPQAHLVLVAGNHDLPKSSETGCVLPLFAEIPRVHVVCGAPERLDLPSGVVWALPEGHDPPAMPDGVLVLHGEITGILPGGTSDRPVHRIPPERLEGWAYVVLGHYHVHTIVRPNAAYVGALEYVSSDVWGELRAEAQRHLPGKGWVLLELGAGDPVVEFRPIPARRHLDLEPIDATGLAAAELDRLMAERVAAAAIDDAVVRLVVTNASRDLRRAIDHAQVRDFKGRALHFQLELRRPDVEVSPAARAGRFRRMEDMLRASLGERTVSPDIDQAALVELGMHYFREAGLDPSRDAYTGEPIEQLAG